MKIERIELFHVGMPLITPWRTAYGEDAVIESVLCRMTSGSFDAWGESCPLAAPCYSPEWAGGVYETARRWLAPALLGQEVASGDDLQRRLSHIKGNSFAKAALDNTWWNLHAQITGRPLHELWGAARRSVPVGADFGVTDSIDELLADIGAAVDQRFPRIKLKYRPGWDLPMLRAVRRAFPNTTIHIDCNSGYSLASLDMFRQVDELNLAMIEQPLGHDDLADHAVLQSAIRTPVCLDESITSPRRAEQALRLKSCHYVNIKPGRVGGLTNALRIHDLCREGGIPCWVGGMLESAVGVAQCISLSMLENFTYPADIFASSRYYREDLAEPPITVGRTHDNVPHVSVLDAQPTPDPRRLKSAIIARAVLE